MRWIWIDGFVDFVSGERACAVKNVTLAEDCLHDHFPGYPVLPPSLMIEGVAQTAGILVGEARGFAENVILAKIRTAEFTDYAHPGDQLRYEVRLESIDERAAVTSGTVLKNGLDRPKAGPTSVIGHVDLMFSHVNQAGARRDSRTSELDMPDHNFVFTEAFLALLGAFRDRHEGAPSSLRVGDRSIPRPSKGRGIRTLRDRHQNGGNESDAG